MLYKLLLHMYKRELHLFKPATSEANVLLTGLSGGCTAETLITTLRLLQDVREMMRPVSYLSEKLSKTLRKYPIRLFR